MNTRFLFVTGFSLFAFATACGDSVVFGPAPEDDGASTSAVGGSAVTTDVSVSVSTSGSGGSPGVTVSSVGTGGAPSTSSTTGSGGSCMDDVVPLTSASVPVDLIVAVVNSSVTSGTIAAVEQSLSSGLVQPLGAAGVDLQTILISDHGNFSSNICMPPPLGNGNCNGPAVNGTAFKQYSTQMPLGGVLCRLLDTYDGQTPDEFGFAPGGWQTWLRPAAYKAFVIFDLNGVGCFDGMSFLNDQDDDPNGQAVALAFDGELLNAPGQFGSTAARRYGVYFAGGFAQQDAANTGYAPGFPTQFSQCSGQFSAPGTGYQWLAQGTEALRFSACNGSNLTSIFPQTAASIESKVLDRCDLTFTDPPGFNPTVVRLDPNSPNAPIETFTQVAAPSVCGMTKGYYFESPERVKLCPAACAIVNKTPGTLELVDPCTP